MKKSEIKKLIRIEKELVKLETILFERDSCSPIDQYISCALHDTCLIIKDVLDNCHGKGEENIRGGKNEG